MSGNKQKLLDAVHNNDLEAVRGLLQAGVHPDKDYPNRPPLMLACAENHLEAANLLHEAGADVNRNDGLRLPLTCLMVAAQNGHRRIVEWLLANGADPMMECKGKTAYDAAANMGHADVAKILRTAMGRTLSLDEKLVAAAQSGNVEEAERLLKAGVRCDSVLVGGFNAFMWACMNGHAPIVKLFLQHGASPYQQGSDTISALQWASMKGRAEVIDVLTDADKQLEQRYIPRSEIPDTSLEQRAHEYLQSEEYARAVAEQTHRQEEEDSIHETADWFGKTGLPDDVERELPRYLRRELGESLFDEDCTKASDLQYQGKYADAGETVHYWLVTSQSVPLSYYAYVEVTDKGQHLLGCGDKQPPK